MIMWPFSRRIRPPVEVEFPRQAVKVRYKTVDGDRYEVSVYPDPANPAIFIIKSNDIVVARVWVDDNGVSLGVSDTVAPLRHVY